MYSGNNCSMLLVEEENISDLTSETPEDKRVYFNIDSKTSENEKCKVHFQ